MALAKDVGIRNAYARMIGVRTGSVTEDEFREALDRYAPWQGLAAMYMVARRLEERRGMNQCMPFAAAEDRYDQMSYRRCGRSGIQLAPDQPRAVEPLRRRHAAAEPADIIRRAFDLGITHIDLANNYGPPAGSAEINFGRILREDLRPYRDELIISTKAGYDMWPGPYGEWGSRKYLLRVARPVAGADGARVRRHLLLAPLRPGHAAGGDDGRAGHRGPLGPRAVRRHLVLLGRAHGGGGRDRATGSARRCSSTSRPTPCSTAGSSPRCWRPARRPGWASSPSRRSRRACSPTATSAASRRTRARRRTGS